MQLYYDFEHLINRRVS